MFLVRKIVHKVVKTFSKYLENNVKSQKASISYTGIVLYSQDRAKLLNVIPAPAGWEVIAHHLTTNLGPAASGPASAWLGRDAEMRVVAIGRDDKVMAVLVSTAVPSKNEKKHITIAVNRDNGGKPAHGNNLTNWTPIQTPFTILGKVMEIG